MKKLEVGHSAEEIASNYLKKLGYKILDHNQYYKVGELDLVFYDPKLDFIVFVEVKSLNKHSPFSIYESLTRSKKQKIKRSINTWLSTNNRYKSDWRFDFIGIITDRDKVQNLEHFKFVEL
jgi:putative endonuclease